MRRIQQTAWLTLALVAGINPASGQTPVSAADRAQLLACIANPDPGIREPCIRSALGAQDPSLRSAGLAAVIRARNVLVIQFEEPPRVIAFVQRIDKGEVEWRNAPEVIVATAKLIELTGLRFSLAVTKFDAATGQFITESMDAKYNDAKKSKKPEDVSMGNGTVSGETVQIGFSFFPRVSYSTPMNCGFEGSIYQSVELRGTIGCSKYLDVYGLIQTQARIRFF